MPSPRSVLVLSVVVLLASSAAARAESPAPVLAVFDVEDGREGKERLSDKRRANLSDYLATLLARGGRYKLVPSAELRNALQREKKRSLEACYDEACQIEIGKAVAAEKSAKTSISRLGDQCLVQAAIYDLAKEVTDRVAHFKGGCDETSLVAAIELVVAELKGEARREIRDSSGRAIHFDVSGVGRMGELRAPEAPQQVTGMDFGAVDVEELELFDSAVKGEKDPGRSSAEKLALWEKVKKGSKSFRTTAVERIEAWKQYIVEEKAALAAEKRLAEQRERDLGKLRKLLEMSVVGEEDKLAWLTAFETAYGRDPAKNPSLSDPVILRFRGDREWPSTLATSKNSPLLNDKHQVIQDFITRYPGHPRAREAKSRIAEIDAAHREALRERDNCHQGCRDRLRRCQREAEQSCHGARGEFACNQAIARVRKECTHYEESCHSQCDHAFGFSLAGK